ncbi:MAG: hypothetical protein MHM6MM_005781 [Cercozoa sp. M6MM]
MGKFGFPRWRHCHATLSSGALLMRKINEEDKVVKVRVQDIISVTPASKSKLAKGQFFLALHVRKSKKLNTKEKVVLRTDTIAELRLLCEVLEKAIANAQTSRSLIMAEKHLLRLDRVLSQFSDPRGCVPVCFHTFTGYFEELASALDEALQFAVREKWTDDSFSQLCDKAVSICETALCAFCDFFGDSPEGLENCLNALEIALTATGACEITDSILHCVPKAARELAETIPLTNDITRLCSSLAQVTEKVALFELFFCAVFEDFLLADGAASSRKSDKENAAKTSESQGSSQKTARTSKHSRAKGTNGIGATFVLTLVQNVKHRVLYFLRPSADMRMLAAATSTMYKDLHTDRNEVGETVSEKKDERKEDSDEKVAAQSKESRHESHEIPSVAVQLASWPYVAALIRACVAVCPELPLNQINARAWYTHGKQ